jgi:DNA-binding NarL/FixJ family response regulator
VNQKGTPEAPLTPDEERVLQLFAEWRRVDEIAATLGVSSEEVRGHVQSLLDKFQVHSRLELLRKTGLFKPPFGPS